jgi:hypothetical protein
MTSFHPGRPFALRSACAVLVVAMALASQARAADVPPAVPEKAACARSAEEGQRLRSQGKLREAVSAFTTCASDGCPALIRSDCGGWLAEAQSALPTVVVRATAAEDPRQELYAVEVRVDDQPLTGKLDGSALAVNPGERHFLFSAPGRLPFRETLVVRVGEQHRLIAVALLSEHARPPPAPPERVTPAARVLLWTGGAALAVSAGFGVAGWLKVRSLRDRCAPLCAEGEVDGARRLLRVADVALGAGAVSLAVAAGLIWWQPRESRAELQVVPVPGGALVGMRW